MVNNLKKIFIIAIIIPVLSGCCLEPKSLPYGDSLKEDRQMLAAICPSYYDRGKGTSAEYVTNTLAGGQAKRAIYLLMPERFRNEYIQFGYSKEAARKVIARFKEDADRGFAWQMKNPSIMILPAKHLPTIDGKIDSKEWIDATVLKGEIPLNVAIKTPIGNALWRLMYDEKYLYIGISIPDKDININKDYPYKADSIEIFIMPDRQMRTYWELILSPGVDIFTAWHMVSERGGFTSQKNIKPVDIKMAVSRHEGGFSIEVAFPFYALPTLHGMLPRPNANIYFMMVRTNLDGARYHRSAPVPLLYDGHNFAGYIQGRLAVNPTK